jgi:hypothetical protein
MVNAAGGAGDHPHPAAAEQFPGYPGDGPDDQQIGIADQFMIDPAAVKQRYLTDFRKQGSHQGNILVRYDFHLMKNASRDTPYESRIIKTKNNYDVNDLQKK